MSLMVRSIRWRLQLWYAIVLAVAHREFVALGAEGVRAFGKPGAVLFDVRHVLPRDAADERL